MHLSARSQPPGALAFRATSRSAGWQAHVSRTGPTRAVHGASPSVAALFRAFIARKNGHVVRRGSAHAGRSCWSLLAPVGRRANLHRANRRTVMVDRVVDVDPDFEIVEYCGRLSCRKPILQSSGRGRRKEFCSDTCRRGADRDYKRAKALVEHFEQSLRRTRHEVAAYGRKAEAGSDRPSRRNHRVRDRDRRPLPSRASPVG